MSFERSTTDLLMVIGAIGVSILISVISFYGVSKDFRGQLNEVIGKILPKSQTT